MYPEKDEKIINDLLNTINRTYCSNPNEVSLNCRIVNHISDHCINTLEDLIKKYFDKEPVSIVRQILMTKAALSGKKLI